MHASDRYLAEGTLEDLQREENVEGYAARFSHGEIGKGLNDYDAIFTTSVSTDGLASKTVWRASNNWLAARAICAPRFVNIGTRSHGLGFSRMECRW